MISLEKLGEWLPEGSRNRNRKGASPDDRVFNRPGGQPLVQNEEGFAGEIVDILADSPAQRRQLMLMGAVPGNKISVEQTSPAYVVFIEDMRFAVDAELAAKIFVS